MTPDPQRVAILEVTIPLYTAMKALQIARIAEVIPHQLYIDTRDRFLASIDDLERVYAAIPRGERKV